ncbi:MAG: hypothetical protein KF770_17620 [Anaerolineae bacterium]|nr:hypothetical protein [Anaerolineae bacterium]
MPRTSITISPHKSYGQPLSAAEIAANRERLAKKIAAATHAVVLPPGQTAVGNGRLAKETVQIMPRGIPAQNKLFEVVEMNVPPPPPPIDKRYLPLTQTILSANINGDGRSEWMRFLFASRRAANGANTRLSKKERPAWRAEGHDVEVSLVSADGDKCWLYVRRVRVIAPAEGETAGGPAK